MTEKTINTRLVLRNADLSSWLSSKVELLKGEIALAKREDGLYEVRIGDGNGHKWNDLSGTGFGHTKFYEKITFSDLSNITDAPNGSIGVVTETLSSGQEFKTAYSYNSLSCRWEALDGNYCADNVYFKENITLAGDYTSVGNIKLSDSKIASAGKSVKSVMENIFTKELSGTAVYPKYTFTVSGSEGSYEVGQTYTVPAATFKYTSRGTYTYNPTDAACEVTANQVTIKRTTSGEETTKVNDSAIALSGTLTMDTGSTNVTFLDYESRKSYTYTCSASHTQGVMPKTNLGNEIPEMRLSAGNIWKEKTESATATFYGCRYLWIGSTADDSTDITESWIKSQTTATATKANWAKVKADDSKKYEIGEGTSSKTSGYTHLTLVSGAKRIILALPASGKYARTRSQVLLQSASNTPITDDYEYKKQIPIGGAVEGANTMSYNIYVYQPAAIGSGEVHDITIG